MNHVILSLAFVLAFLLLNHPDILFITRIGSVAWYPAVGLSFALMFGISPKYAWLACLSDAVAGIIFYHQPIRSFSTIAACGLAMEYAAAAYILRGPLRVDLRLRRGRDIFCFIFVSMAAAITATITGVLCLIADHSIAARDFYSTAVQWLIGDCVGLVGLAPALLIHIVPRVRRWLWAENSSLDAENDSPGTQPATSGWALAEAAGQTLSLLAILWIIFGPRWAYLQLFYLSFIPVLWMAMRSGVRLVASGTMALNFGIVVAMHIFPPEPVLLTRIGLLMLVVSATGLIVGSAVTEREYMGIQLQERTTYLDALFEKSPLGIVVLTRAGRVDLVNDAFVNLSQYRQSELVDRELDSVFLPVETTESSGAWSLNSPGAQPLHRTVQRRRKDGTVLDIELHAVPLVIAGRVEGAYAICQDITEQNRAATAEREHAKSLDLLVKELAIRAEQMTRLKEMAGLLECSANTKEACSVVGQVARNFFPDSTSGTLFTFRASRNLVEAAASWGHSATTEPMFSPQSCWALRRGQPHWSNADEGVVCPHLPQHSAKYLCIPMVGQGETLGVLQIEFPIVAVEPSTVDEGRLTLAVTVASEIAMSLGSLQLRETLRDQSIRDPLTGLFNRRFMQESLEREMMRARRKKGAISLLYIDVDHFKRFNDSFGHDAGDLVLQSFAELLRGFFRGEDVACRCGGEEFAVILPDSSVQNAALRAEELRKETKRHKLQYRNRTLDSISISVGVACFPEDGQTSHDLLNAADQCLYQSKSAGRDRVTVAVRKGDSNPTPTAKTKRARTRNQSA